MPDILGQVIGWHFGTLSVHNFKAIGLHGFLQQAQGFGVYFSKFFQRLVIGEECVGLTSQIGG